MEWNEEYSVQLSAVHGLTTKTRSLASINSIESDGNPLFIVGTSLLSNNENEVHILEYIEDKNEIRCSNILNHPNEILSIESSLIDQSLFFTAHSSFSDESNNNENHQVFAKYGATLWRIPVNEDDGLAEVTKLPDSPDEVRKVLLDCSESRKNDVVWLDVVNMKYFDLERPKSFVSSKKMGEQHKVTTGCRSPHFSEQIVTANEGLIRGWDMRDLKKETYSIKSAHSPVVRDLDLNPSSIYRLASCGDDGFIRFWDLRNIEHPLKSVDAHLHWAFTVKWNRSYEQLVLSSGTDCAVKLWNMPNVSNDDTLTSSTSHSNKGDHLVSSFDDHEESVYCVAWSSSPWIFASLSYDGRLVVNRVPKECADAILLT